MATFVENIGVAHGDVGPESFIFTKDYHHLQTFSKSLAIRENFLLQIIPVIR